MKSFERSWYELRFELNYKTKKFSEFQNFFSSIMETRYCNDFAKVRPRGNLGGQKNYGYLKSQRQLFQVYAPLEMKESDTVAKIKEDFDGALVHWKNEMGKWTFVHNCYEGLGPLVTKQLLKLDGSGGVKVSHWGFPELRETIFELEESDIIFLLGKAPSNEDVNNLRIADLPPVIEAIIKRDPPIDQEIKSVPIGKIEANRLSFDVKTLLMAGYKKTSLVDKYFAASKDPELGDRIAEAFRSEYKKCRDECLKPDEIFHQLYIFAGGNLSTGPAYQVAILSILAYYFEQCDIFEPPKLVDQVNIDVITY
jgi:hypothetical protein